GAYGGMASFSTSHPVFGCASYRDPNLSKTLKIFGEALNELTGGLDEETVDQNIIGTIGRIDTPRSPHEKGLGESISLILGHSPEFRQHVRDSLLAATPAAVARLVARVIDNAESAITVLGSAAAFDNAANEGLALRREKLLG
ncbi:MAG: hypothetical protein PHC61_03850, partial [Chitinivibrionales bacterium]|nr:hypothetical protein [Chitinivibrionales bacterium]